MSDFPDLTPPWSMVPLVHETTKLFPAPTMDALAGRFAGVVAPTARTNAAVLAAITAAGSGGTVYLGPGEWPLSSTWTFDGVNLTVSSVIMVFFVPFFGLLSRAAKVYRPTFALFAIISLVGMFLVRYLEVYPSLYGVIPSAPFGLWEIGIALGFLGVWGASYLAFMNAFPRVRAVLMTSPYRDEVQVPVNPETMEPLPAHE